MTKIIKTSEKQDEALKDVVLKKELIRNLSPEAQNFLTSSVDKVRYFMKFSGIIS